jgi:hypothetical protein
MSNKRFQAESFTPTKWSTAEEKSKFANRLLAFIAADCPESKFTKAFYNRLSQCFGFVAHYDRAGFLAEFFACTADKLRFVRCLTECPCYGSPEFTFSDVERAISVEIRSMNYVDAYEAKLARETETRERQQLAALQAKYLGSPEAAPASCLETPATESVFVARPLPPLQAISAAQDVQFSLFG